MQDKKQELKRIINNTKDFSNDDLVVPDRSHLQNQKQKNQTTDFSKKK